MSQSNSSPPLVANTTRRDNVNILSRIDAENVAERFETAKECKYNLLDPGMEHHFNLSIDALSKTAASILDSYLVQAQITAVVVSVNFNLYVSIFIDIHLSWRCLRR
jgi:hypothetical protein